MNSSSNSNVLLPTPFVFVLDKYRKYSLLDSKTAASSYLARLSLAMENDFALRPSPCFSYRFDSSVRT